ncbi:MAG TPA: DUF4012 domain-containing protein [Chloroflexota bacterium]
MLRRILISVAALLIVLAVAAAFILFSARRSLSQGVSQLRTAQDQVQLLGNGASVPAGLQTVRNSVVLARDDFRSADDHLALLAPLLEHLGWVPLVGVEVAAAPHAAHAASRTTDGALSLLDGLGPLASLWGTSLGGKRAPVLVNALAAGRPDFDRACSQFADAENSRRQISGGSYPAALSSALRSLDDRLPRLLILCRALALAPSFLGARGPVSYLVVYQNSDELRATGGFIGSASLLTVHQGAVSQLFQGTGIRDNLSIPPPEPVAYYNREIAWLFRDSNWSPDFPTSAGLERFFYHLDFHRDIGNVVNLTPQAASDILAATGPIYVPEYGRLVTGANVAQLADYYAHWTVNPAPYAATDTAKKQFIGIVARHVLQRLTSLPAHAWIQLGNAVATASEHGDMLLNFRDQAQQALLRAAGASHAISPRRGDYLYVVNTNLSYNKISKFVHLRTAYTVRIRPDRWLDAHLTIRLKNVPAPPSYHRDSLGPQAGGYGNWDDYATFLRIYIPPGAQLIDQTGWTQPWSSGPAYGGTMFSGYLIVPRGSARTIRLRYIVPPNVFTATHGQSYTLLAPHQPGSYPESMQITVRHDGVASAWTVPHPVLDWRVTIPLNAHTFHPIPLPSFPPPATTPGGWVEPHAFLARPATRG